VAKHIDGGRRRSLVEVGRPSSSLLGGWPPDAASYGDRAGGWPPARTGLDGRPPAGTSPRSMNQLQIRFCIVAEEHEPAALLDLDDADEKADGRMLVEGREETHFWVSSLLVAILPLHFASPDRGFF
jgi:hypothetical protein